MNTFPATISPTLEAAQRIEALLSATHALRDYRLVLKQGEPFSPIVLRVHSDPLSIINKVFEQNPKSYTKLQEFIDIGANMIRAGLIEDKQSKNEATKPSKDTLSEIALAEKRITAMSVEAALREDDFETAYSYVVNRLGAREPSLLDRPSDSPVDIWSWPAAFLAGKYLRTARTVRPTHLGTGSGNPDIRHLEQRMECLSTALRIAPESQLREILDVFCACEQQLESAMLEERAQAAAWDDAADLRSARMPGSFAASPPASRSGRGRRVPVADDASMSLFDLSRATARLAQQNFTALSGLQRSNTAASSSSSRAESAPEPAQDGSNQPRTRRRDQLREAAMETLVSGVGWLINAPPVTRPQRDSS